MAKKPSRLEQTSTCRKILIVDDHPMMREGLRVAIDREADMVVCGEVAAANLAMDAAQRLSPDLALVDVTLPGRSGLELVKDLRVRYPELRILAISMHEESLYAERMLRAGANGYITKQQPPEELVRALRRVLAGHMYVSNEMSETLLTRFSSVNRRRKSALDVLTDREFEVFQLLGQGAMNKEISERLRVSAKTVAVHSTNIRKKLGLANSAQLIRFAVQHEN